MFLHIPTYRLADFDFAKFADHVLDHSPVFATRSQLRLGMKARDAIAAATDGVAEIPDDAAELFQRAAADAPIPRLQMQASDAEGRPLGESLVIGARAYDPFYAAVEGMTKERPELPAPADQLAVAAE